MLGQRLLLRIERRGRLAARLQITLKHSLLRLQIRSALPKPGQLLGQRLLPRLEHPGRLAPRLQFVEQHPLLRFEARGPVLKRPCSTTQVVPLRVKRSDSPLPFGHLFLPFQQPPRLLLDPNFCPLQFFLDCLAIGARFIEFRFDLHQLSKRLIKHCSFFFGLLPEQTILLLLCFRIRFRILAPQLQRKNFFSRISAALC